MTSRQGRTIHDFPLQNKPGRALELAFARKAPERA